jgi:hypothetical protein
MVLDQNPFTEIEILKNEIAELTKQHYTSLKKIKELVQENDRLRNKQTPKESEPEKSPLSIQTKGYPSEASVKAQMRGH